jgi:serine/threonine-protein kinase HipA
MRDIEERSRWAAFNIFARNKDDHVKSIAFLMDTRGQRSA